MSSEFTDKLVSAIFAEVALFSFAFSTLYNFGSAATFAFHLHRLPKAVYHVMLNFAMPSKFEYLAEAGVKRPKTGRGGKETFELEKKRFATGTNPEKHLQSILEMWLLQIPGHASSVAA